MTKRLTHRSAAAIAVLLCLAWLLPAGAASAGAGAGEGNRTYTGTIDGAEFRVEVPRRWNGTLILYSHPYYTADVPAGIGFSTRPETGSWLLEHGYALAASDFKGRDGFAIKPALEDQVALLDWFETHVGRPRHTIATGTSMGGAISVLLAERNPRRFDGVLSMCGTLDAYGQWNLLLDVTFAIKTLLAPGEDIDVVKPRDPAASTQALQAAVARALTTPEGRARLALANAFGGVDGWNSSLSPKPAGVVEQVRAQAELDQFIVIGAFGPAARIDLEQRASGNPSWNTGIDYRRQLAHSDQRDLVRRAYAEAGLEVEQDLAKLAAAPRISPDPAALAYLHRYAVPSAATPAPVLTMHNISDVAVPAHERWYAERVRLSGGAANLRQTYLDRAGHCAFSAAEEITGLRTLLERVETGFWPSTSPHHLNAAAGGFGEAYQKVFDFPTGQEAIVAPAFVRHQPGPFLRPSR